MPDAPWDLTGEAAVFLTRRGVKLLVHYRTSPVGPYNESALAVLGWRGPTIKEMLVTSAASREGGRSLWGFPKEVAALRWQRLGRWVRFHDHSGCWRLRSTRCTVPCALRLWTVQHRDRQWVRVPIRIAGQLRLAWRGRQLAFLLENFTMTVAPAQPLGRRAV